MNKTTCIAIQQELDESSLGDDLAPDILEHLESCPVCSDFNLKQTKLRHLVGSLGTVSAPADFDFRLRARLASESQGTGFHFWSLGYSTLAAALAVVLLVGVSFVVFQLTRSRSNDGDQLSRENPREDNPSNTAQPSEALNKVESVKEVSPPEPSVMAKVTDPRNGVEKRSSQFSNRNKRALAVSDLSSEVAPSVRDAKSAANYEAVFPVQASQQSLRLSLFDARGNAKTISLPTVSFGSQRVVPTTTSVAQKGVW